MVDSTEEIWGRMNSESWDVKSTHFVAEGVP